MSKKKNSGVSHGSKQTQYIAQHADGRPCAVCVNGKMDQAEKEFIDQYLADNDDCFAMFICPITSDEAEDMLNDSNKE